MPVSLPYIKTNHLMMLETSVGYLDLFDYIPGFPTVDVQELFDSKNQINDIPVANIDWLRKMKEASGRRKDLDDLDALPAAE